MASAHAVAAKAELSAALERKQRYDGLARSTDALQEALMPCGMDELPNYTVTGARAFRIYPHACANNRCPKRLFDPKQVCSCCCCCFCCCCC